MSTVSACLHAIVPATYASIGPDPGDFEGFKTSISLQIFKVNSNVQGINRLIDKLGTAHDGAGLRKSL
jgi:syntaxin 7